MRAGDRYRVVAFLCDVLPWLADTGVVCFYTEIATGSIMMANDKQIMNTLFHTENVEEFSDALNYLLHRSHDEHVRINTYKALQQAIAEHLERRNQTGKLEMFASIRDRICTLLRQFYPDLAQSINV